MKAVRQLQALPGKCGMCGSSKREAYIDTNLDFDGYGVFYICNQCVAAMSRKLKIETAEMPELATIVNHLKAMEALIGEINDTVDRRVDFIYRAEQHMRLVSDVLAAASSDAVDSGQAESGEADDTEPAESEPEPVDPVASFKL